eukprot:TRINITY_DN13278_c0_g1_i3.p1 TRINITY_DN13278_c0_g1~~TRINITY_DN13278_c0_g1_i3.p1  ORF type:complete len:589 (+),score=26.78 TRINITY_DN13278_c0_g1_i3:958-2724(+)
MNQFDKNNANTERGRTQSIFNQNTQQQQLHQFFKLKDFLVPIFYMKIRHRFWKVPIFNTKIRHRWTKGAYLQYEKQAPNLQFLLCGYTSTPSRRQQKVAYPQKQAPFVQRCLFSVLKLGTLQKWCLFFVLKIGTHCKPYGNFHSHWIQFDIRSHIIGKTFDPVFPSIYSHLFPRKTMKKYQSVEIAQISINQALNVSPQRMEPRISDKFYFVKLKDAVNAYDMAAQFSSDEEFYKPRQKKVPYSFLLENSGLLKPEKEMVKCPPTLAIPLTFAKAALLRKDFKHLDKVTDEFWIKSVGYDSMRPEERRNVSFAPENVPRVERLLKMGDGTYKLPKTVSVELLKKAKARRFKKEGSIRGQVLKYYGAKPIEVATLILSSYQLKKCVKCQRPAKELLVTNCCGKAAHRACIDCKACPMGCKGGEVVVKEVKHWKKVFEEKGDYIARKVRKHQEKIAFWLAKQEEFAEAEAKNNERDFAKEPLEENKGEHAENETPVLERPQSKVQLPVNLTENDPAKDKHKGKKPEEEVKLSKASLKILFENGEVLEYTRSRLKKIFMELKLKPLRKAKERMLEQLKEFVYGESEASNSQ